MSQSQANLVTGPGEFLRMILNPDETYVLGADIDLSIFATMYPIGSVDEVEFSGTLIGNGYKVEGARLVPYQDNDGSGLFYGLNGATFEDVEFVNMATEAPGLAGVLSPTSSGQVTLTDVVTEAVVPEGDHDESGLIANSGGPITADGCEFTMVDESGSYVGCISGMHSSGDVDISSCVFNLVAENVGSSAGGAIGDCESPSASISITDSESVVSLSAGSHHAGFIAGGGFNDLTATGLDVTAEFTDGFITGGVYGEAVFGNDVGSLEFDDITTQIVADGTGDIGGIVGSAEVMVDNDAEYDFIATNIDSTMDVGTTGDEVGGVAGVVDMSGRSVKISDCTSSVTVETAEYGRVGGLVGSLTANSYLISNSECSVEAFTESSRIGGIAGEVGFEGSSSSKELKSCNADVDIAGSRTGGIVGDASDSTIVVSECTATGEINDSGAGDLYSGGVVGYLGGGDLNNCVSDVEMDIESSVGGIVGFLDGDMSRCISLGDVRGTAGVSPIAGFATGGSIDQCAAFGKVTILESESGMIAGNYSGGTVTNCYILSDIVCKGSGSNGLFAPYSNFSQMSNVYYGGDILERGSLALAGGDRGDPYGDGVYYKDHDGLVEGRSDFASEPTAIPLTEEEMTGQEAEDNMPELDFDAIWNWTGSYPALQWQTPELALIEGTITDAFGEPAAGEPVAFGDAVFATDADGNYEAELEGGQTVEMQALQGLYSTNIYTGSDRNISLQYSGIEVEVRHPYTDEPIEAAPVRINEGAILTDSDGVAQAPKLPGGEYNIQVLGIWEETVHLDDEGDTVSLEFNGSDRSITADFTIEHIETGNGLEEVDITLPQVGAETFTNEDGEGTLVAEGVDGQAFIYVAKEDPRFETQSVEVPLTESQISREVELVEREPMRK